MDNIQLFNVTPSIPEELKFLEELAHNVWWTWTKDAIELFRRIDSDEWQRSGHNPQVLLNSIQQDKFQDLAEDDGFLSHLKKVQEQFAKEVLAKRTILSNTEKNLCIAYFSLEYGLHESVRLYSGGLGILAGDHLKASSCLDIPLVGVGLLYRRGYFKQLLNKDGWQQEVYQENEVDKLPLTEACDKKGKQVMISIDLPDGKAYAIVWKMSVGRIPLYLLDTDIAENKSDVRSITMQLYGGDSQYRLKQELLLGIGGMRALLALNYEPAVCHMNEGHAAFMSLERIRQLSESLKLDTDCVHEIVRRTNIFTTHTPIPAGNETFDNGIAKPVMDIIGKDMGITGDELIKIATDPNNKNCHEISMTILGLKMSQYSNGVSKLHGKVSRDMWAHLWPDMPNDELPIEHITNGVHVQSWISPELDTLLDRYLGPNWRNDPANPDLLDKITRIPDQDLWRAHCDCRTRLIRTVKLLREEQLRSRNAPSQQIDEVASFLDDRILTIGFARRFATYKRATLLLKEPQRLEAILTNTQKPVQIIFAGKAHPADNEGKALIKQIVDFANQPAVKGKILFVENYDIFVARRMVQGVDVWLNNPRRPLEASGTSGMKAAINGSLNISTLDGWWCEGYDQNSGWAIGAGEEYADPEYQDSVESQALYNLLENDVINTFYDNSPTSLPTEWISKMKASIQMAMGYFDSQRMVGEYYERYYEPSLKTYEKLVENNASYAKELLAQKKRLDQLWNDISIEHPTIDHDLSSLHTGDNLTINVQASLGKITPDEVNVEVYYGPVNSHNQIKESHAEKMEAIKQNDDGSYTFQHQLRCNQTGRYGLTTRVVPKTETWKRVIPGYIKWAKES